MAAHTVKERGPFPPFGVPFKDGEKIRDLRSRVATEVAMKPEWLRADFHGASLKEMTDLETAGEADRVALESIIIGRGKATSGTEVTAGQCFLAVLPPPPAPVAAAGAGAVEGVARPAKLEALRKAIVEAAQVDDFIILGGDAKWPQLGATSLFVRHFYDGCYRGPLGSLKVKGGKFVLLGNAGIGKSAYGCYLLYRAIRDGRTVVYQSAKLPFCYVFYSSGDVAEFPGDVSTHVHVLNLLEEPTTVFISDSITPKCVEAFTILITSPKGERWSDFRNEPSCKRIGFPVYTWEEILTLQERCFPAASEGLMERFARWGGIPRYVLAKTAEDDQRDLESALTAPDYRQLAEFLGKDEVESEAAVFHRLLHLKVRGELDYTLRSDQIAFFHLARTEFASSYIADKVCEALMSSANNQLRSLLSLSPRPAAAAKLYGEVFERAALKQLCSGGKFRIRKLVTGGKGEEKDMELPPTQAPVAGFWKVSELLSLCDAPAAAGAGSATESLSRVLRPTSKSFCAIDFVFQGKRLANATVNKSHELILKGKGHAPAGLLPVAHALGFPLDSPIEFYWIVPEADFNDWKLPQKLVPIENPTAAEKRMAGKVVQFVLAVPFEAPAFSLCTCQLQAREQEARRKRSRPDEAE